MILVQPDTVVRWHREWLRRQWTWRSTRRRPGRPSTNASVRTLVGKMAAANPLWGAPRIHGELGKLGIAVSERTVSRLLRRPRRPPSQTWRTFLTNHVAVLASMDFFTVPTLTGRVLFVLVLLTHQRRRIIHFNVTEHPTAAWTAQQIVDAFPDDTAPRWLLRDRDAIYGDVFRRRVAGMGIGKRCSIRGRRSLEQLLARNRNAGVNYAAKNARIYRTTEQLDRDLPLATRGQLHCGSVEHERGHKHRRLVRQEL